MLTPLMKKCIICQTNFKTYVTLSHIIRWDKNSQRFRVESNPYLYWQSIFDYHALYPYAVLLLLHAVWKYTTVQETGGFTKPDLIRWLLCLSTALAVILVNLMFSRMKLFRHEAACLFNEMFDFNNVIMEILERKGLQLPADTLRKMRRNEMVYLLIAIICVIFPLGFTACFCSKEEATHILVSDWFEVEISLKWSHLPFLAFLLRGVTNAASILYMIFGLGYTYIVLITGTSDILKPKQAAVMQLDEFKSLSLYTLETYGLGNLKDYEIVRLYRKQRIIATLINQIFASLRISFQHIVLLMVALTICYFFVRGFSVILRLDFLALVVLTTGFITSMVAEYIQAEKIGELVQSTERHVKKCRVATRRTTWFWKTARSWPPRLTFQVAYPFFVMDKHSFPQFCEQVIDFLITLLSI